MLCCSIQKQLVFYVMSFLNVTTFLLLLLLRLEALLPLPFVAIMSPLWAMLLAGSM